MIYLYFIKITQSKSWRQQHNAAKIKMKNITILTKKTGAGHYVVSVFDGPYEKGSFITTDMQLIDDIQEMRNDGFEHELQMHNTFDEVKRTCLEKIN